MGKFVGTMTVSLNRAIGWSAVGFLFVLCLGPVAAVAIHGSEFGRLPAGSISAFRFTVLQAGLSAFLSVIVAIPLARALARRKFAGRDLLVSLLGVPFILPSLVAVLGMLEIFGRTGVLSDGLKLFGMPPMNIYGLPGILLAHVFFNLPLVTRLLLQGWSDVPGEHFRLAAQLDMRARDIFWQLEWPLLRRILPGAFLLVFLLCSTSFAVVLTMGGGPAATTLELAIFHSLRQDFNLSAAAQLAMLQVLVSGIAMLAVWAMRGESQFGKTLGYPQSRWDSTGPVVAILDYVTVFFAGLFLMLPILVVLFRGMPEIVSGLPTSVWAASLRSISVALASAVMTVFLALAIAQLFDSRRNKRSVAEFVSFLPQAVSPFVLGTGLFIMLNPFVSPFALALPITAVVNACMCVPLALRGLLPALAKANERYGRLATSLDLHGTAQFRIVIWPEIRRPTLFSAAVAAALSMGDLGVVSLFALPEGGTLPLQIQRLMSAYQMEAAQGVAALLLLLSLGLFVLIDRGGRIGS